MEAVLDFFALFIKGAFWLFVIIAVLGVFFSILMAIGRSKGYSYPGDRDYPGPDPYAQSPSQPSPSTPEFETRQSPQSPQSSFDGPHYFRDSVGRIIGETVQTGNIRTVRDGRGMVLGWYNPETNLTHDIKGRVIGSGDLSASLL